jgi:hypothetical protein
VADRSEPDKTAWRISPRELGKQAYRDGQPLIANPFEHSLKAEDWSDGWLYQQRYYPRPGDRERR